MDSVNIIKFSYYISVAIVLLLTSCQDVNAQAIGDVVYYHTQQVSCSGNTYTFSCENDYVMWVGQGMNWGVMHDDEVPSKQCSISTQDCYTHESSNNFIKDLTALCSYNNTCTYTVPTVTVDGCEEKLSDFAFLLFRCGTALTTTQIVPTTTQQITTTTTRSVSTPNERSAERSADRSATEVTGQGVSTAITTLSPLLTATTTPYRDPSFDLVLYNDQELYCAPGCYEFRCDPGRVMWVGQGMTWGVKSFTDPTETTCTTGQNECRSHKSEGEFLEYLTERCNYRNSCWFTVPQELAGPECGGRPADWVFVLFKCGLTSNPGKPALPEPTPETCPNKDLPPQATVTAPITTTASLPHNSTSASMSTATAVVQPTDSLFQTTPFPPATPFRTPALDFVYYRQQRMFCSPGCYQVNCDPGMVMWVGQGLEWGSKAEGAVDTRSDTCGTSSEDCRFQQTEGEFISYLTARCNYRNNCWFQVPRIEMGGGCEGRLADWAIGLFKCGRTQNPVAPQMLPPRPGSTCYAELVGPPQPTLPTTNTTTNNATNGNTTTAAPTHPTTSAGSMTTVINNVTTTATSQTTTPGSVATSSVGTAQPTLPHTNTTTNTTDNGNNTTAAPSRPTTSAGSITTVVDNVTTTATSQTTTPGSVTTTMSSATTTMSSATTTMSLTTTTAAIDPSLNFVYYRQNSKFCSGECHSFQCDRGLVMWVGQGLLLGVKNTTTETTDSCSVDSSDCRSQLNNGEFLETLTKRCNYRNSCWFEVPQIQAGSSCGGKLADWALALFQCGSTGNAVRPALPEPKPYEACYDGTTPAPTTQRTTIASVPSTTPVTHQATEQKNDLTTWSDFTSASHTNYTQGSLDIMSTMSSEVQSTWSERTTSAVPQTTESVQTQAPTNSVSTVSDEEMTTASDNTTVETETSEYGSQGTTTENLHPTDDEQNTVELTTDINQGSDYPTTTQATNNPNKSVSQTTEPCSESTGLTIETYTDETSQSTSSSADDTTEIQITQTISSAELSTQSVTVENLSTWEVSTDSTTNEPKKMLSTHDMTTENIDISSRVRTSEPTTEQQSYEATSETYSTQEKSTWAKIYPPDTELSTKDGITSENIKGTSQVMPTGVPIGSSASKSEYEQNPTTEPSVSPTASSTEFTDNGESTDDGVTYEYDTVTMIHHTRSTTEGETYTYSQSGEGTTESDLDQTTGFTTDSDISSTLTLDTNSQHTLSSTNSYRTTESDIDITTLETAASSTPLVQSTHTQATDDSSATYNHTTESLDHMQVTENTGSTQGKEVVSTTLRHSSTDTYFRTTDSERGRFETSNDIGEGEESTTMPVSTADSITLETSTSIDRYTTEDHTADDNTGSSSTHNLIYTTGHAGTQFPTTTDSVQPTIATRDIYSDVVTSETPVDGTSETSIDGTSDAPVDGTSETPIDVTSESSADATTDTLETPDLTTEQVRSHGTTEGPSSTTEWYTMTQTGNTTEQDNQSSLATDGTESQTKSGLTALPDATASNEPTSTTLNYDPNQATTDGAVSPTDEVATSIDGEGTTEGDEDSSTQTTDGVTDQVSAEAGSSDGLEATTESYTTGSQTGMPTLGGRLTSYTQSNPSTQISSVALTNTPGVTYMADDSTTITDSSRSFPTANTVKVTSTHNSGMSTSNENPGGSFTTNRETNEIRSYSAYHTTESMSGITVNDVTGSTITRDPMLDSSQTVSGNTEFTSQQSRSSNVTPEGTYTTESVVPTGTEFTPNASTSTSETTDTERSTFEQTGPYTGTDGITTQSLTPYSSSTRTSQFSGYTSDLLRTSHTQASTTLITGSSPRLSSDSGITTEHLPTVESSTANSGSAAPYGRTVGIFTTNKTPSHSSSEMTQSKYSASTVAATVDEFTSQQSRSSNITPEGTYTTESVVTAASVTGTKFTPNIGASTTETPDRESGTFELTGPYTGTKTEATNSVSSLASTDIIELTSPQPTFSDIATEQTLTTTESSITPAPASVTAIYSSSGTPTIGTNSGESGMSDPTNSYTETGELTQQPTATSDFTHALLGVTPQHLTTIETLSHEQSASTLKTDQSQSSANDTPTTDSGFMGRTNSMVESTPPSTGFGSTPGSQFEQSTITNQHTSNTDPTYKSTSTYSTTNSQQTGQGFDSTSSDQSTAIDQGSQYTGSPTTDDIATTASSISNDNSSTPSFVDKSTEMVMSSSTMASGSSITDEEYNRSTYEGVPSVTDGSTLPVEMVSGSISLSTTEPSPGIESTTDPMLTYPSDLSASSIGTAFYPKETTTHQRTTADGDSDLLSSLAAESTTLDIGSLATEVDITVEQNTQSTDLASDPNDLLHASTASSEALFAAEATTESIRIDSISTPDLQSTTQEPVYTSTLITTSIRNDLHRTTMSEIDEVTESNNQDTTESYTTVESSEDMPSGKSTDGMESSTTGGQYNTDDSSETGTGDRTTTEGTNMDTTTNTASIKSISTSQTETSTLSGEDNSSYHETTTETEQRDVTTRNTVTNESIEVGGPTTEDDSQPASNESLTTESGVHSRTTESPEEETANKESVEIDERDMTTEPVSGIYTDELAHKATTEYGGAPQNSTVLPTTLGSILMGSTTTIQPTTEEFATSSISSNYSTSEATSVTIGVTSGVTTGQMNVTSDGGDTQSTTSQPQISTVRSTTVRQPSHSTTPSNTGDNTTSATTTGSPLETTSVNTTDGTTATTAQASTTLLLSTTTDSNNTVIVPPVLPPVDGNLNISATTPYAVDGNLTNSTDPVPPPTLRSVVEDEDEIVGLPVWVWVVCALCGLQFLVVTVGAVLVINWKRKISTYDRQKAEKEMSVLEYGLYSTSMFVRHTATAIPFGAGLYPDDNIDEIEKGYPINADTSTLERTLPYTTTNADTSTLERTLPVGITPENRPDLPMTRFGTGFAPVVTPLSASPVKESVASSSAVTTEALVHREDETNSDSGDSGVRTAGSIDSVSNASSTDALPQADPANTGQTITTTMLRPNFHRPTTEGLVLKVTKSEPSLETTGSADIHPFTLTSNDKRMRTVTYFTTSPVRDIEVSRGRTNLRLGSRNRSLSAEIISTTPRLEQEPTSPLSDVSSLGLSKSEENLGPSSDLDTSEYASDSTDPTTDSTLTLNSRPTSPQYVTTLSPTSKQSLTRQIMTTLGSPSVRGASQMYTGYF